MFLFVNVVVSMSVCTGTLCVLGASGGQKMSDSPELELQETMSVHVGAGNLPQVICKGSKCS